MCQYRPRMRGRWRRTPSRGAGGSGPEPIEIRTADGWALRADLFEPTPGAAGSPRGVAVLAHALMARRSEFHRPAGGLAGFLAGRGWRVVSFDFRGHGGSGPAPADGGTYGYDDLVRGDWPAISSFARSRARGKLPVVVVGHSLGGHTSLAAQGTGALDADAIVGFGASPWIPELEPSRLRWLAKQTVLRGMLSVTRRVGRFPARALGRGSDDESLRCVQDIGRFARLGGRGDAGGGPGWRSADGRDDYIAALGRVPIPVLQVVSGGDRLECPPACGAALLAACRGGGERELLRIDRRDDGGPPPGHMGMVTSDRVKGAWAKVEEWMAMCVRARSGRGARNRLNP
jgi:predicted alpha/beta hydrolase